VVNFQTPADLAWQKYPVLIELEATLAREAVWTFWRREKSGPDKAKPKITLTYMVKYC
jgi:hypothetical protein